MFRMCLKVLLLVFFSSKEDLGQGGIVVVNCGLRVQGVVEVSFVVHGLWFRVQGSGQFIKGIHQQGARVQLLGSRRYWSRICVSRVIQELEFIIQGIEHRVQGFGLSVLSAGCRVDGVGFTTSGKLLTDLTLGMQVQGFRHYASRVGVAVHNLKGC